MCRSRGSSTPAMPRRSSGSPSSPTRSGASRRFTDRTSRRRGPEPQSCVGGFDERQNIRSYSSARRPRLDEVLSPLAESLDADLYLPSGEISDTLLAMMARTGAEDGREMVVLVMADCDPAGYQMAVSIGHKLRAFREAFHPSLRFRVHAPALTVEQVKALDLPSTPLKETEARASGWRERYGVEQTEIDALATLRPELLREIVEEACDPYFDATLRQRMNEARDEWQERAQEALEDQIDPAMLADIPPAPRPRSKTSRSNSTPSKASATSISISGRPICLRPTRPMTVPNLSSPAIWTWSRPSRPSATARTTRTAMRDEQGARAIQWQGRPPLSLRRLRHALTQLRQDVVLPTA